MTTLNSLPKIHLHPILLVFIIISFFTGTFMELAILLFIVFFHEMGHLLAARHFKWRIRKVMLWVFGGVMDTEEHGSKPLKEEMYVTCAGPFQHIIIYLGLLIVGTGDILPPPVLELFYYYNTIILLFNLLPIWPLDGGKLLLLFLSSLLPYKKAYYSIIFGSMIASLILLSIQLFAFPFTLSSFFIFIFLFMENRTEWKQRYYAFMRFLLQRYEEESKNNTRRMPIHVKASESLMEVFSYFYRERKHDIHIYDANYKRHALDEAFCLKSFFYDKQVNKSIGEIADHIT
ncbi:site-2 protease family protein [Virgibacillus salexigens]|nr:MULTISPECIES: site-2 protease family protein [Virgibacillus]GGJ49317.1 stage IV sporulation protein FB [Virgibacillus kapii]